ncbi:MAG: N-acyl homoserine lactonase family protein [Thermomicrobiales bacterium]
MVYDLYAIKYGQRAGHRAEHFQGGDPHDGPMPLTYYVWAAVSPERTVVIDLGFTVETGVRRGRVVERTPAQGLQLLGIDAATVQHVIVTHFHFDHVGNVAEFPNATFVVQDGEMAFWTGRYASRGIFRNLVEPEDVVSLVRHNFDGRVKFVDGSEEIVPGIAVHKVGGHAPGLQVVTVETARGLVVVASDAAHFYANIEEDRPFSIVTNLPQMYGAFDIIRKLAPSPDHIIPGHDPLVLERYPAASPELAGLVARLG